MADSPQSPAGFPIPPASFEFLVESILMQAQMHLGLLHFGDKEEKNEANLPLARHSIDLLSVLADKTRGNLTTQEQRLLENGLTELRFRYVQVAESAKKTAAEPLPSDADEENKADDRPLIITADGGKGSKTE